MNAPLRHVTAPQLRRAIPHASADSDRAVRGRLGPALLLAASLVASGVAPAATTDDVPAGLPDFRTLVERRADAVVSVAVERHLQPATASRPEGGVPGMPDDLPDELRRFFEHAPDGGQPMPGPEGGLGSGFIVSADGYLVTNAHVVDGASKVTVALADRRELPAKVIGSDPATDIALLKVDATGLPVVELGDSDKVEVGQWVLAIGSPFGLEHTATQGIVSAVARSLPSGSYAPFIQTDVAVNPGNSGGPLFDTEGRVIGVNSQIYSRSGGYQGLSFAIPINVTKRVVEQLRTSGHASRGWLGVAIQDVDQALADAFGLDAPAGALVADVTAEGPAAKGGIEAGDIVVEFDGTMVTNSGDLPALVGEVEAGHSAEVTVLREGQPKTFEVVIGEFDQQALARNGAVEPEESVLGVRVAPLEPSDRAELGLEHGVRVTEVAPEGTMASAGIEAGDVIVSLGGEPLDDAAGLARSAASLQPGDAVAALVRRGERTQFVAIEVPTAQG